MGKALADAFPVCRDTFAEADEALGEPLSARIMLGAATAFVGVGVLAMPSRRRVAAEIR